MCTFGRGSSQVDDLMAGAGGYRFENTPKVEPVPSIDVSDFQQRRSMVATLAGMMHLVDLSPRAEYYNFEVARGSRCAAALPALRPNTAPDVRPLPPG